MDENLKRDFIGAIHAKKKLLLKFNSKEDASVISRTCAPMDFGPSRRGQDQQDRFHFWDYTSDKGPHTLSLLPLQIVSIEILEASFDPREFVTWDVQKSPWFVKRDWGSFS